MNAIHVRMLKLALPALCLLGAAAPSGCGGSGSSGSSTTGGASELCLQTQNCTQDEDCLSGAHCNLALSPPQCEKLYCDAVGAPCSETATCKTGLSCDDEEARCCVDEGLACDKDEDCCSVQVDNFHVPQTCASGVCAQQCPKCKDWLTTAGTSVSDLCPDARDYASSLEDCGCEFCSLECTNSADCGNFSLAAAGGSCTDCVMSHCGSDLTACMDN